MVLGSGLVLVVLILVILAGLVLCEGADLGGGAKGAFGLLWEVAIEEGPLSRGVEEVLSWLARGECSRLRLILVKGILRYAKSSWVSSWVVEHFLWNGLRYVEG